MTNPAVSASAPVPPGWYADPWGNAAVRWWDGQGWAAYVNGARIPRRVPARTAVFTWQIWVLALAPVIGLVSIAFARQWMALSFQTPQQSMGMLLSPWYWGTLALSLLVWAVGVVLALFDRRALLNLWYDAPFHWAFAFISSTVYVIGRSIIVRRRAGRGISPLWVTVGILIAVEVLYFAVVIQLMTEMLSRLSGTLAT